MFVETLKNSFRELKKDKLLVWSSVISLLSLLLPLSAVAIVWQRLPPVTPFFYSLPWGEEQLAPKLALVILPGGGVLLYVFNLFLALLVRPLSVFYTRISLVAGAAGCVLIATTTVSIILLII